MPRATIPRVHSLYIPTSFPSISVGDAKPSDFAEDAKLDRCGDCRAAGDAVNRCFRIPAGQISEAVRKWGQAPYILCQHGDQGTTSGSQSPFPDSLSPADWVLHHVARFASRAECEHIAARSQDPGLSAPTKTAIGVGLRPRLFALPAACRAGRQGRQAAGRAGRNRRPKVSKAVLIGRLGGSVRRPATAPRVD
jgi:hypothetical protein